jgi:hypothetical protein
VRDEFGPQKPRWTPNALIQDVVAKIQAQGNAEVERFAGFVNREQAKVIDYLREENRVLKATTRQAPAAVHGRATRAGSPPRQRRSAGPARRRRDHRDARDDAALAPHAGGEEVDAPRAQLAPAGRQ